MSSEPNARIKHLIWLYNIDYEEIAVRIGYSYEKFNRLMRKKLSRGNRKLVLTAIEYIVKENHL